AEISGGMARRVALARAMALDPELLLYDEPFTGLDPISMAVAANLIRTLNDTTGATSILVSHDVEERSEEHTSELQSLTNLVCRLPPHFSLFPYTTLFRSAEISGGMARRVALARAMALDPELLLYDEPFTGLDPISMAVAANLIRTLNDTTGATSILVSHDVEE